MKPEKIKKLLTEYQTQISPWGECLDLVKSRLKSTAGRLEGEVVSLEEKLADTVHEWAGEVLWGKADYKPVLKIRENIAQKKAALADLDESWKQLRTLKSNFDNYCRNLKNTSDYLKKYELAIIEAAKLREQAAIDPAFVTAAAEAVDTETWLKDQIAFNLEEAEGLLQAAEDLRFIKKRSPQK